MSSFSTRKEYYTLTYFPNLLNNKYTDDCVKCYGEGLKNIKERILSKID